MNVLAILLPCGTILYSADMFRKFGLVFYPEQFFAAMFGLAATLVYLHIPASRGRERQGRVPWYDVVAAALSFTGGTYIAIYYPVLSELSAELPISGMVTAAVMIVLLVEGLRRTAGKALTLVVIGFIALAMVGHLLPGALTGRPVDLDRLLYYLIWDSTAFLGAPLMIVTTIVVAFILFGQALSLSGGSVFFTDISLVLMGRYRGGPAKISIVASSLFGTISGSTVANVVSTGVVTIPLMKQAGYRAHVAGAIEAVASTGGQLMPPVMGIAAFIMAEFLQVSYVEVAIAAAIPSLIYYAALFIEADLEAARYLISRVPEEKIPAALQVMKDGWHFPVPFVILVAAIFWFNYPLDKSALLAVAIVVVLSMSLGYKGRRLNIKGLVEVVKTTGFNVLDIFMICAGAGIVIGVLNISGLGFGLTLSLVELAGGSLILLLVFAAIASIVLGMGMPTVGVYILLATLVAPALVQMKIDPMAAHLFVLYYGMMSMITPPVAVGAFAAATVSGADAMRTGFAAMRFGWAAFLVPFLFVFSGTLILRGDPVHIILDVVAAISGVWFVSAAMIGYTMRPIGKLHRALYGAAGLALLIPIGAFGGGRYVNIAGASLGAILLFAEFSARWRHRVVRST